MGRDLTDFIPVGHGYAGTIISKVVEVIPERVRRLVFWSAYVLNDRETALEMLPDSVEALTQMATESADNTFMIPFDMWREVFINDVRIARIARVARNRVGHSQARFTALSGARVWHRQRRRAGLTGLRVGQLRRQQHVWVHAQVGEGGVDERLHKLSPAADWRHSL